MKTHRLNCHRPVSFKQGFALIVVLSLMIILIVVSVGLLTLASVSLRSSGQDSARAEAQANARLALILAIGELQSTMGPDQSVSARASSIDKGAADPNMLGTWESWHWEPGDAAPDYSEKADRFRRWLVSTVQHDEAENPNAKLSDPIWLMNPATVGGPTGTDAINSSLRADRVPLLTRGNHSGVIAWAVMDESQKAPIQLPELEPVTDGERLSRRTAPSSANSEAILSVLAHDQIKDPSKIVSMDTAVVAVGKTDGKQILGYQADVTPYSEGLITNVVDGGFKYDLTTLFESSSASPSINGQPTLYHTADDGAPSWEYLRNHYQGYTRVTGVSAGKPTVRLGGADLSPAKDGVFPSNDTERLMPVIAKLQIMFSVVSHYSHIQGRVNFYNSSGGGNLNYAVPHLVYDPVVTLYNPYDVALDLSRLRVRIWDPPVLFGFKKNSEWLRRDFAAGNFQSLARFSHRDENDVNARRYFTMLLTDLVGNRPGARIHLEPGEVRVFSPWVESNWSWALETADELNPRCFFDWDANSDFGNVDNRANSLNLSIGRLGLMSVPGWDQKAGLQTDHLSYARGNRPQATLYGFERSTMQNDGWVAIKLDDTFSVEARAGRSVRDSGPPDFAVDLLAGSKEDTTQDILRSYRFRYGNAVRELSSDSRSPYIRRSFRVGDILQKPRDTNPGGKSPFAILTMSAKTTKAEHDISMPWLHNNLVTEGADQDTSKVGNALDSYDLRLEEVADFNQNPGGIEFDSRTNRGYFGATSFSNGGVTNVPMFRVPLLPASSLGDLIPSNLVVSSNLPRVTHPLGNSRSHPLIPADAVSQPSASGGAELMLDHSYLINDALWDQAFFSTVANYTSPLLDSLSREKLLTEFFKGNLKLMNPRFKPLLSREHSAEEQATKLNAMDDATLSRTIGGSLAIKGPFNINSDSKGAWKALLSSLRGSELNGWGMSDLSPQDKTGFPRAGLPIAGDTDSPGVNAGINLAGQVRWAGFRALDDTQIDLLAEKIVEQIRARGGKDKAPSLTLGEFVNRRIGPSSEIHTVAGLLQTAIEEAGLNSNLDSWDLSSRPVANSMSLTGIANAAAREGKSAEGAPSMLTQGDLLMGLAPVITVRGDTFRIRAYGASKGPDGIVKSAAWCEAVVQRIPRYVDDSESAELKTDELTRADNIRFGRRFVITSFRWLSPEEI